MMREIKFRAYCKKRKEFVKIIDLGLFGTGKVKSLAFTYKDEPYERVDCDLPGDVELMQYTGLKDTNGVNIYEGDIVEVNYIGPSEIKIITYHNASYGIRDHEIGFVPLAIFERPRKNVTVLGNIYENPELLGDNQ